MQSARNILVVDNDWSIVQFIAEVLSDEGYTVHTALTLADARLAIKAWHPDLVLLDFYLKGETGDQLVRALKFEQLADIPIILMTADRKTAAELSIEGIDFCLIKPFDLDTLVDCVAKHIRPNQATAA